MKRGIIVILILFILGISLASWYIWDNAESTIRGRIEKAYYNEMEIEDCGGANNVFNSRGNCLEGIRCISKNITENINKEDLKEFEENIDKDYRIGDDYVYRYFGSERFTELIIDCVESNGGNLSLA